MCAPWHLVGPACLLSLSSACLQAACLSRPAVLRCGRRCFARFGWAPRSLGHALSRCCVLQALVSPVAAARDRAVFLAVSSCSVTRGCPPVFDRSSPVAARPGSGLGCHRQWAVRGMLVLVGLTSSAWGRRLYWVGLPCVDWVMSSLEGLFWSGSTLRALGRGRPPMWVVLVRCSGSGGRWPWRPWSRWPPVSPRLISLWRSPTIEVRRVSGVSLPLPQVGVVNPVDRKGRECRARV